MPAGPRIRAWSWASVPALFVALTLLAGLHGQRTYGSPLLLATLNVAVVTASAAFIAYAAGRAFLARGAPGLLLLVAGVVVWGAVSLVAVVAFDHPNSTIAVHNGGVLLAGLCHLGAAFAGLRPRPPLRARRRMLAATALAAAGAAAGLALLERGGALPTFFVEGAGGTPVRQLVLSTAIAAFGAAAALLWSGGASRSPFRHWYALGAALLAVGLYGVLLQSSFGGLLGWLGRSAQYLGALSMLAAAVASVRQAHGWDVPLEALLRDSEGRYQALFRNMSEALFLAEVRCDAAGAPVDLRLLDANPAFELAAGRPREQVLGASALELLPGADAGFVAACARAARSGAPAHLELRDPLRGGEHQAVVFAPAPGQLACLLRDVSQERRALTALREIDRRKTEFLGMLSHELRNPLAPIRNAVQVLERAEPGSGPARRAQQVIGRQAEHLARLVDDLLDVTRIERGKIQLRRARADLRELTLRAGEDHRPALEARGLSFEVALPEDPLWAEVDAVRVIQIIGNLLHNAAKFTPAGGAVTLALRRAGEVAELVVRDTGAGIDPALLPRVFDPFVQGERTLARSEGGLGLGLALVRGLVALHGGEVHAASEGPGRGAELVVRLPAGEARATPAPGPPGRAAPRALRVLVVDDNRDACASLCDLLALHGHLVEGAHDGAAALSAAGAHPPDLVLCDLGLPGMSGYDVARALRQAAGGGPRLVAVSGYARPDDVRRALDAGFDGHLAKPCDPEELLRLVGDAAPIRDDPP